MIYFLYGEDFAKTRSKLREIIASQLKKNPEASYFKIDTDTWSKEKLEEFLESRGLFQSKYLIVLENLFADKKILEEVKVFLEALEKSENIFIIVEGPLTKEVAQKIEKRSAKTQVFGSVKEKKQKKDFDIFSLTDSFASRDKKRTWLLYQKAMLQGVLAEEVHRLLFWQTKAMLAAQNSKDASDAGLNPFVYKKSLGFSKKFTKTELETLSRDLVTLHHDARRGIVDFDIALEKLILGM